MALNLEIKIKINSEENYINRIFLNKGKFLDTLFQKDIYYTYPHGLLKLRIQKDSKQLIKYRRNENAGENRWSDYSILMVSGEDEEKYLGDLFKIETVVEKERKLYMYKNTRIHLDTVKKLGSYLELETVVKEINETNAISEFNEVINFLEIDTGNEIKKSYRDLMLGK